MKGLTDHAKDFEYIKGYEEPLKNLEQKGWELDFRKLILRKEYRERRPDWRQNF